MQVVYCKNNVIYKPILKELGDEKISNLYDKVATEHTYLSTGANCFGK